MRERFHKEGLDFEILKPEDRILQVWRWLVDAESNLHNSRRMLDKLYEQQHEEIEVTGFQCSFRSSSMYYNLPIYSYQTVFFSVMFLTHLGFEIT